MVSYAIKKEDDFGCVHSVDNLVLEYVVRNYNHDGVLNDLAALFEKSVEDWDREKNSKPNRVPSSRYSWFRSSMWGGGYYVEIGQFGEYDKVTKKFYEMPLLRLKFNPNKYFDTPFLNVFLSWSEEWCEVGKIVRFDYAVDIPTEPKNVIAVSKKEFGLFKGTRYFGQGNNHGRLKIYDKQAESHTEMPLTRCEWTFCENKEITFDKITCIVDAPTVGFSVSDLGSQAYAYAKMVCMISALGGDVQEALSLLSWRTRKKIEPYTVGSGIRLLGDDTRYLEWVLQYYCDVLSVSYMSPTVKVGSIQQASDFEELPL